MVTRGLGMFIALQAPMPTSYRVASFDGNGWPSELMQTSEDGATCIGCSNAAAIYGVKACC